MKCFHFLLLVVATVVLGIPEAQSRRFVLPQEINQLGGGEEDLDYDYVDEETEESSSGDHLFPDPLAFDCVTIFGDSDQFKGELTIRNGVVQGLPSFWDNYRLIHPFGLSSFSPTLILVEADFDVLKIIGDYELRKGYIILPAEGTGSLSETGIIHSSLAGASLRSVLQADPVTGSVSFVTELTSLSVKGGGAYFAENYLHDGELFHEWTEVEEDMDMPGVARLVWEALRDDLVDEMNKQIEGLTLGEITQRLDSRRVWKI